MKTTLRSKTFTASLPQTPDALYAWICTPEPWAKKENVRHVRNDHTRSIDIVIPVAETELRIAIRILANGEGSETIATLIQPRGVSDSIFNEHVRWADSVLRAARKAPATIQTSPTPPTSPTSETSSTPSAPSEAPYLSPIPTSGKKLFIGNLPFDWTEEMLSALFKDVAETNRVEIARFRGRNGRSRGFGFVEMMTEEGAQTAIGKLHEAMAGTRKIIVRLARSQESRPANVEPKSEPAAAAAAEEEDGDKQPMSNVVPTPAPRPHAAPRRRPPQPQRPKQEPRTRASRLDRPYKEIDIVNNSGYEYFPRRAREK